MLPFTRRGTFGTAGNGGVNSRSTARRTTCTCLPAYGLNVPGGLIENSVFVDRRKTPPASKRSVVYGLAERKGDGVGEGGGGCGAGGRTDLRSGLLRQRSKRTVPPQLSTIQDLMRLTSKARCIIAVW